MSSMDDVILIDVRSSAEYNHAHIPNAINLPIFDNAERATVGTAYKQESREKAIKIGLDYFGHKMRSMVEKIELLLEERAEKTIYLYCWRGGMRSNAVAWLLDMYGFEVYLLVDGYKAFRNWVLDQFTKKYKLKVLGGYTGSGKTKVLNEKSKFGHTFIDLEKLACHKGSSFGHIGMPPQPSQEFFENTLATHLYHSGEDTIWLEDESQRIGHVHIPTPFWQSMLNADVDILDIPFDQRLNNIVNEYGFLDKNKLVEAINRISKRLGGLDTKNAIHFIQEDNIKEGFKILLSYYDRQYAKASEKRKPKVENYISIIRDHD